jgi:glycosyltransferase involved in cell wall biosynthesis
MKNKSTNILYFYTERKSFVQKDLAILELAYTVTPYQFRTQIKRNTPLSFLRQFFFLLTQGWKYDFLVCFFAGYHSVLPALFAKWTGKKCILFLGGTDCFKYPSFQYGNFTRKWYGKATCLSVSHASMLVPVSQNLIHSQSYYYTVDSVDQGVYHWCQPLKTPHHVIALEYNATTFSRQEVRRQDDSFITVAFGIAGTSFVRKGIDKMVMLATSFPQYTFTIIGCNANEFPVPVPSNLTLIPPVPYGELPMHYSRHQFYLQLSIAEGFPSAICEAMLCECIPIGSNVAAIPDIISTHGFIVSRRDDALIRDTVRAAVSYADKATMGAEARKHIMQSYGEGKRAGELYKLFHREPT